MRTTVSAETKETTIALYLTIMFVSRLPVAMCFESGVHAMDVTLAVWYCALKVKINPQQHTKATTGKP
jgi:hypothetical protein